MISHSDPDSLGKVDAIKSVIEKLSGHQWIEGGLKATGW